MKGIFVFCYFVWGLAIATAEETWVSGNSCEKRAMENSLRCLQTIRGDQERIANTQSWVAENLAYLGQDQTAFALLRSSQPHYHLPSGCVDTAMVLLGKDQRNAVTQFIGLALDLLPFAVGRGAELVQFKILRMATVIDDSVAIRRAWESEKLTHTDFRRAYQAFQQDWKPHFWNTLLDRLFPQRQWRKLKDHASRDEEIDWMAERTVDNFSALLFIREAEARVRAHQSYPASWIVFVEAGIRAPSINTRPATLSAEFAELALLEGRKDSALACVETAWKLLSGWGPHMSGVYRTERDLALILARIPEAKDKTSEAGERLLKRAEILCNNLDPYEQLLQLPLLAEGLQGLGKMDQAENLWKKSADLCAKNLNPESQSIGLTRLWMSYARAKVWPKKETQELLIRTEKLLPQAYSKVNF